MAVELILQDNISTGITFNALSGVEVDYTEDGTPRQRIMFTDKWEDAQIEYNGLTNANINSLKYFVTNNRTSDIEFTIAGNTYTGKITGALSISNNDYDNLRASLPMRVKVTS